MADELKATPVKHDWVLSVANALKSGRDFANKADVPVLGPMGDFLMGKAPEGLERIAYDEPMTTGKGWTTKLRPETIDLGFLAADVAPAAKASVGSLRRTADAASTAAVKKITGNAAATPHGVIDEINQMNLLPAIAPKKPAVAAQEAPAVVSALRRKPVQAPRMSAQEARDAGYWHGIGLGKKLERPYDEMTFTTENVKDLPERHKINIADLKDEYIVPAIGDRTAAGKILTGIDDVKFQNPVTLEGGPDFMLTHGSNPGPESTIWASKQGVVSALRNRALEAEKLGGNANLMYVPMGYDSLNFSTMPVDAALEMIRSGKITKKAKGQFNDAVRSLRPEFAGIDSPDVLNQLHETGALRHAFLDRMQLDDFKNAGFPDMAAIRKAIMEPSIADVPNYHGGYSVGKIDTSQPINKDPLNPHTTYKTQLHGHVVGGMDEAIPHTMLWRDFFAGRRADNRPVSGDRIAFERSKPLQKVDQQLIDEVSAYIEALRQGR